MLFYQNFKCNYRWLTEDWNRCSTTCGGGTRQRNVICTEETNSTRTKVKGVQKRIKNCRTFLSLLQKYSCLSYTCLSYCENPKKVWNSFLVMCNKKKETKQVIKYIFSKNYEISYNHFVRNKLVISVLMLSCNDLIIKVFFCFDFYSTLNVHNKNS